MLYLAGPSPVLLLNLNSSPLNPENGKDAKVYLLIRLITQFAKCLFLAGIALKHNGDILKYNADTPTL